MTSVHYVLLISLFFNPGHLCAVCVDLCQIDKFLQTTCNLIIYPSATLLRDGKLQTDRVVKRI